MRIALTLLLALAAAAHAQERKPETSKRLASITWDLASHKLTWEIQTGSEVDGEFQLSATAHYEISPDDAVMQVLNERRGFTAAEAKSLHRLLDTLSLYCAESVVWWNQGQGEKLEGDPGERQVPPRRPTTETKVERVRAEPRVQPAPQTAAHDLMVKAGAR